MQKEQESAAEAVVKDTEISVTYEVINKKFPTLTMAYVKEKNKTYVLAWKRYVMEDYEGDVRKEVKQVVNGAIYDWILRVAMYVTYRETHEENSKKK